MKVNKLERLVLCHSVKLAVASGKQQNIPWLFGWEEMDFTLPVCPVSVLIHLFSWASHSFICSFIRKISMNKFSSWSQKLHSRLFSVYRNKYSRNLNKEIWKFLHNLILVHSKKVSISRTSTKFFIPVKMRIEFFLILMQLTIWVCETARQPL